MSRILFLFLFALTFLPDNGRTQVRPIIDNGFLSDEFWASGVHPSGNFILVADRSVIHAYNRKNKMLFQTYQAPCIVNSIWFSPDGKLMLVNTLGEINEDCNRALVFDFYTGKILYNQKGRHIETVGKGNNFYIRKNNDALGIEHLEVHSYNNPSLLTEDLYFPAIDTFSTVLKGKKDGFFILEGAYTPNDIRTGKLPLDSLPERWNNANLKKDPLKYLSFEYEKGIGNDSGIITQLNYSLIIDTLGIVTDENNLEVYGIRSGRLLKVIENARFFGHSYLAGSNHLHFMGAGENSRSVTLCFDPATLEVERKSLTSFYGNYRVMINDSAYYEVDVEAPNILVSFYGEGEQKYLSIKHPFDRYELYNGDSYSGKVFADQKLIIHNKNKVIDLNNMTITDLSVFIDTTLLHPAVVTMLPSNAYVLKINGWTWDMRNAQQFIPKPSTTEKNIYLSDSTFFNSLLPLDKPSKRINHYLAGHLSLYDYDAMSYPFMNKTMSHFSNAGITPASNLYLSAIPNAGSIYTDKQKQELHLLNPVTGTTIAVSAPFVTEKELQKAEDHFRQFVEQHYTPSLLSALNKLPDYTMPGAAPGDEERYPYSTEFNYSKENHFSWVYAPLLPGKDFKYTTERETALQARTRNLFKFSLQPRFPLEQSEYTVNIINNEGIPMLDYAGIIPENDIYYSDLTLPLTSGKLISLNYAYGIFSLKKADGSPIVQSSLYRNGEFIHVTPDGYYFASKSKLSRISLRKDNAVYPIEQFDLKYNRPDIVLQRLGCTDASTLESFHKAYLKRLKKMGFTEDMLKDDFHLPDLSILNQNQLPTETDSSSIRLQLEIKDELYRPDRINVLINNVPVYGTNGISLREKNANIIRHTIDLKLCEGENKISVSVLNGAGAESYQSTLLVNKKTTNTQPDLYLVAIGDSKYTDSRYDLSFAAKDATDISKVFENNTTGVYRKVYNRALTNEQVTRENIKALKDFLSAAKINDVVMVTVAGHGVLDKDFNYYLATHDMDFNDPAKKGLPYEELESLLDGIAPLRKTILIDACHSGEVDKDEVETLMAVSTTENKNVKFRAAGAGIRQKNLGLKTTSELMNELFTDLRTGTGATVISSASGVEYAMESDEWNNGLFTYSFLYGLKSLEADLDKDGEVWLSEMQKYLGTKVSILSNGKQQPTSRIENPGMDFRLY